MESFKEWYMLWTESEKVYIYVFLESLSVVINSTTQYPGGDQQRIPLYEFNHIVPHILENGKWDLLDIYYKLEI